MIYPIAAIVLLWLLLSRADALPPFLRRMTPGLKEKAASIGMVVLALLVLVRGNVWLALLCFGIALWLLGRAARFTLPSKPPSAATSRLRSATIEMHYDHRSGAMSGSVIAGAYEGAMLDRLDREQCGQVYRTARQQDPEGARLLEAYFDRRFAGWRGAGHGDAHTRTQSSAATGRMSEDEAYEILGLHRGATRDEVVRSHRTVMKKWHPDQGGTADLAARANEAKEVLLRRHT